MSERLHSLFDLDRNQPCSIRMKSGTIVSGRFNGLSRDGWFGVDGLEFHVSFVEAIYV